MTATLPISESKIWDRVIAPEQPMISPLAAAEILKWSFSTEDRIKMAELAAKARAGTLTAEENKLIEEYESIDNVISLMKSKARRSLKAASSQ